MSKIKLFDQNMYNSIEDAIREISSKYKCCEEGQLNQEVYTPLALDMVLNFLCLNNIQHTYTITGNKFNVECSKLVTLGWTEPDGSEKTLTWFEKGVSQKYYLVKYADNWRDEMDIDGFMVFTAKELIEWSQELNKLEEFINRTEFIFCIGTNEEMCYWSYADFISTLTLSAISEQEANFLTEHFGKLYGFFPYECVLDFVKYMEEEQ